MEVMTVGATSGRKVQIFERVFWVGGWYFLLPCNVASGNFDEYPTFQVESVDIFS